MKAQEPNLKPQVKDLHRQAGEYAFMAALNLSLTNPDTGRVEFYGTAEEYRIHYLFPNLHDDERTSILGYRYAAEKLSMAIHAIQKIPGRVPEAVINGQEQDYMYAKCEAEALLHKLSPLQQQILQGPLFTVRWPMKDKP